MVLEPGPAMFAIVETFIQLLGVLAPKPYHLAIAEAAAFCRWAEPLEELGASASLALKLPMTPSKDWLHMDTVELDKLHWTQDLPPLRRQQTQEVRTNRWGGVAALLPRPGA